MAAGGAAWTVHAQPGMVRSPARFFGSRPITNRAETVIAVEHVVRVDDLEARALAKPGDEPASWTLVWTRGGRRYTHEITTEVMRHHGQRLQGMEKAIKRLLAV